MMKYGGEHPWIRAYMAGVTVPAVFLLGVMMFYVMARLVWELPVTVERVIAFPMAIIPNAWGLWNLLYVALRGERAVSLGCHGALLPWLLIPLGWPLASLMDIEPALEVLLVGLVGVSGLYYLLWRFLVTPLNRIVGVYRSCEATISA
ncbi:MAG: hypothetical protein HY820_21945 [Acidobacteria bacterium]|nr:hypothetical protein [Acidobacteriota bacterium]